MQEPDWSFFTNWSSPSLQPARILGHHGRLWKQHHSEYPILKILLLTRSFIFPWPGYIANRGRTDVPPERTWRPVLRAMGPKQGESAKRARLRVQLEFICLSSSISKGKAAIIVFVYLTIFATLLIDLLACVPLFKYEHAFINIVGLSKKKKCYLMRLNGFR